MNTFIYTAVSGYVKPKLEGGRELINALKSGLYAKTKVILKDHASNAYWCLGVKCDLDLYFNPDRYGQYIENSLHGGATVLPKGHPWEKLYGCPLYFPKGFLVSHHLSINPGGAVDFISSIASVNDLTEDFSMVINILEAAWDCV